VPSSPDPIVTLEEVQDFLSQDVEVDAGDDAIGTAITIVTETLEDACRCAFTPRTKTQTVEATSGTAVLEPMVIEVTQVDESPASLGPFASGVVPLVDGVHTVTYTHGHQLPPARIKRAALLLIRHLLSVDPSDFDARATHKVTEMASWSLITPGVRGAKTPLPEVNQIIADYSFSTGVS
jgi:hypothetical protein